MLGWSLEHRGEELLGHPVSLSSYVETGAPTGVALLHPWANRLSGPEYEIAGRRVRLDMRAPNVHADAHGLPIHGLVAGSRRWAVVAHESSRLTARLDFASGPELMAAFPFEHVLELTAALFEDGLRIGVTLTPSGDAPVPVAFGFHPYLTLPRVPRADWRLRLPAATRLSLDDRGLPTGQRTAVAARDAPLGAAALDDHFTDLGPDPAFTLSGGGRALTVRFLEGYTHLQVFAPTGKDVVALEPMTAPTDALRSGEGLRCVTEPFRAVFAIELDLDAAP